jgi:subtilisin family serine protease
MRHLATTALLACLLLVGSSLLTSAAPSSGTKQVSLAEVYRRQILVKVNPSTARSTSSALASKGVSQVGTLPLSYATYQIVEVPADKDYYRVLAQLNADASLGGAWPNVIKQVSEFVPNDPLFLNGAASVAAALQSPVVNNAQWALLKTRVTEAWDTTAGVPTVVVAVIDTGASLNHEDLKNRLWTNPNEIPGNNVDDDGNGFIDDIHGYDFTGFNPGTGTGGDNDPEDTESGDESHGTACSSIIAGQSNNGIGMAGIAGGKGANDGVRIMVLRVGTRNNIQLAAEIAALDYAHSNGARVASMSFGGTSGGQPEEDAVNRAWDNGNGTLVIAAAGNFTAGNGENIDLPAGFENCMCVGATTIFSSWPVNASTALVSEQKADFSKSGPEMDIVAPGVHIISAASGTNLYFNSPFRQFTGTSAATPVVSGLAALLFSAKPSLTAQQARDIIYNTAIDLGQTGLDTSFGHGRIDMRFALNAVTPGAKPGDTNGDGVVDDNDVQQIIDRFGARSGDGNFRASADCNNDGVIDELDLFVIGRQFGN